MKWGFKQFWIRHLVSTAFAACQSTFQIAIDGTILSDVIICDLLDLLAVPLGENFLWKDLSDGPP